MGRLARTLGLAWTALAGMIVSGCFSEETRLVQTLPSTQAADLEEGETPRVSRMQTAEPPSLLRRSEPPPIRPVSNTEISSDQAGRINYRNAKVKVRAWVNGKPIFDEDIYPVIFPALQSFQNYSEPERSKKQTELFNLVLEQFIERELLYQDAVRKLEANNPKALKKLKEIAKKEFEKQLRQRKEESKLSEETFLEVLRRQGMTLESWEHMEVRKFIATEYLRNRIIPLVVQGSGRPELDDYYQQHSNEFQRVDSVKWQDIFIAVGPKHPTLADARRRAEQLLLRLKNGEEFKNLLSEDDGPSHLRNGEGIGQRRGEIQPPELEPYLFELRDGQIGPLVELSTGYHLLRLLKREYAGPIPFNEETQKVIATKLRSEIFEREVKRIIRELKSRSIIEIDKN